VPIYDRLSLHKDVAKTTRFVRFEDATIPGLSVKVTPYVEVRKAGTSTFTRFNGPFTLEGLLHFLQPNARAKRMLSGVKRGRSESMGVCEIPLPQATRRRVARRIMWADWDKLGGRSAMYKVVGTALADLGNNQAVLKVNVKDIRSPQQRNDVIERISGEFMEITNSPNIVFEISDTQSIDFGWNQLGTSLLEPDLEGGAHKREVLNWASGCSKVIMDLKTANCPSTPSNGIKQLCYRLQNSKTKKLEAIFAVCYDTKRRIPLFTAHVINPEAGSGREGSWVQEKGLAIGKTSTLQAHDDDYTRSGTKENKYYLARGHLVPNADFGDSAKKRLTFHLTNVAPQWQPANNGNWKALERAVATYGKSKGNVFVLTGTAEHGTNKVNKRVVIPGIYWKAICDKKLGQSLLFWSTNPNNSKSKVKVKGCTNVNHTTERGIVQCLKVDDLKTKFKAINSFQGFPAACKTNAVGAKLLKDLKLKFK